MFYYGHPYHFESAPTVVAQPPPPPPAPATSGGIQLVLEYDLNYMATFVLWCAFGMLKRPRSPSKEFELLMASVLFATRLPKLTIVIGLEYMNQRFYPALLELESMSEHDVFCQLIVALVLANKFNDDNTFTNKLWCGATGLLLTQLNQQEAAWLAAVKWNLNVVNFELNILTLEECWRSWMELREPVVAPVATAPVALPLTPFLPHHYAPVASMTPTYSAYPPAYSSPLYSTFSHGGYGNYNYVPSHVAPPPQFSQPPAYGFSLPHNYGSPVFDPVIQYAQKSVHQNPYYFNVY